MSGRVTLRISLQPSWPSKSSSVEVLGLQHRAHGAVGDDDAARRARRAGRSRLRSSTRRLARLSRASRTAGRHVVTLAATGRRRRRRTTTYGEVRDRVIELEGVPELVDPLLDRRLRGLERRRRRGHRGASSTWSWSGTPTPLAELDPEDYYDFQVNRPTVARSTGRAGESPGRPPGSRCARPPGCDRDVVLIRGIEPNMRWRSFCDELLGVAASSGVEMVVTLGALLADTPHTRPSRSPARPRRGRRAAAAASSRPATRARPASSACSRTPAPRPASRRSRSGPRCRTTSRSRPARRRPWPCCTASRTCSTSPSRSATCPRRPGLGARRRRAGRRGRRGRRVRPRRWRSAQDTADLPEATGDAIAREFERYLAAAAAARRSW